MKEIEENYIKTIETLNLLDHECCNLAVDEIIEFANMLSEESWLLIEAYLSELVQFRRKELLKWMN